MEVAKQVPLLEPYLYYPYLTLVTFGRWDELLAMPLPPVELAYSRAMTQYARGVALAATHRFAEAQAALDTLQQIAASGTRAYASAGWTTPSTNLQIATHALLGEIAARQGALEEGIAHFREAMKIEDDQLYTEPPDWYYPIRHSLAAVLLRAGQPVEAERLYRGSQTVPGKRLVAVRAGPGAARAGEERRGGGRGRPLCTRLGRRGCDPDGLPLLGTTAGMPSLQRR